MTCMAADGLREGPYKTGTQWMKISAWQETVFSDAAGQELKDKKSRSGGRKLLDKKSRSRRLQRRIFTDSCAAEENE